MPKKSKRAIFSLSKKDPQFAALAQVLMENGWTIYATPGTYKFLFRYTRSLRKRVVLRPIQDVSQLPFYQHASLTLAPRIHAALQCPGDSARVGKKEVRRVALLCIDLTLPRRLKDVDVGGPALIRSALKGKRIIVTKLKHVAEVIKGVGNGATVPLELSQTLKNEAVEALIADIDLVAETVSPGEFKTEAGRHADT